MKRYTGPAKPIPTYREPITDKGERHFSTAGHILGRVPLLGVTMKFLRKLFTAKCCECGEVSVWWWQRRCDFCDVGEGAMK